MSFISFIFALLPWYAWIAIGLAVAVLAYTGLLAPVVKVVVALARQVPWEVWAILGGVVLAGYALKLHDEQLVERTRAEDRAACKAGEDAANEAQRAAAVLVNRKLEIGYANAQAEAAARARELAQLRSERDRLKAEIDRRRNENVTETAIAMCRLTRGVIVQFNEGADAANGADPFGPGATAAGPGPGLVDQPSEVPLDRYVAAVDATQGALHTCRDQVTGWQQYHAKVIRPWIATAIDALSTCIPKGAQQ